MLQSAVLAFLSALAAVSMRCLHILQFPSTRAVKVFVCAAAIENIKVERNKIPDFMIEFILINFNGLNDETLRNPQLFFKLRFSKRLKNDIKINQALAAAKY
jgi:hypothetical protein